MMKKSFLLILLLCSAIKLQAQFYTAAQIQNIQTNKSAAEGDMYKDTQNNLQYIGTTDGSLKLLSPYLVKVFTKTNNYTLTLAEIGGVIRFDSASPVNLIIPQGLPVGYNISIYQVGNGPISIVGSTGVTILNRLSAFKTAGKDAGVGIIATSTDTYHITGDVTKI